jgi:peroxiredoxin
MVISGIVSRVVRLRGRRAADSTAAGPEGRRGIPPCRYHGELVVVCQEGSMVKTLSTMTLPLGAKAPAFRLRDPAGRLHSLQDSAGAPALLVAFICNHCPFVKHIREGLAELARDYRGRGVAVVAINSNDYEAYPDDRPEKMGEEARATGYDFPYLVDEDQEVAKRYQAACTPDFFVFDAEQKLVYRGQMDGSRPGNDVPVSGADLRAALDAVLAGQAVAVEQTPSIGCNIKWRPGNEPDYFKP